MLRSRIFSGTHGRILRVITAGCTEEFIEKITAKFSQAFAEGLGWISQRVQSRFPSKIQQEFPSKSTSRLTAGFKAGVKHGSKRKVSV